MAAIPRWISYTKNFLLNPNYQTVNNCTQERDFIKNISQAYQTETDRIHLMHEQQFSNLDFSNVIENSDPSIQLSYVEHYFLKTVGGQTLDNLHFPLYWTLEYHIDYKGTISKFIQGGYLRQLNKSDDLSLFTIEELKRLLKLYGLKVSGKKAELISRLAEHGINKTDVDRMGFNARVFVPTDKGNEATKHFITYKPQ